MDTFINKLKKQFKHMFPGRDEAKPDPINIKLNHKVLVGTDHKTGTVWLLMIFQKLCRELGLKIDYRQGEQQINLSQAESLKHHDIFFHDHSNIDLNNAQSDYRGLHLIRDPRDVIISGCFYHQKSSEEWLHRKDDSFGGMTYQEKINSYESLDDQILFEMENTAAKVIRRMLDWDYTNTHFIEVKYDDLILDSDLLLFHQIFTFLGFPGSSIPNILRIAYDNSLFSGNVQNGEHVRSGKSKQWVRYFAHVHKRRFLELFGDALIRLGYESDNRWADNPE